LQQQVLLLLLLLKGCVMVGLVGSRSQSELMLTADWGTVCHLDLVLLLLTCLLAQLGCT
jgi:hypothetical protein